MKRWKSLLTYEHHNVLPLSFKQAEPDENDEIVIAMSSGVDSSVAAALYASKYKNVRGVYMANWSQTAKCTEADWNDVQKICQLLNIPCERVNFEREYWNEVFMPMISDYQRGLTPNPDIGCNKYVKFGKMVEHLSNKLEAARKWWLVTGHYARVMKNEDTGRYSLLRGLYPNKDQSYYLSMIPLSILPRVLMPIGHMTKPEVREKAQELNLHVASKPDSQGLCFVSQEENSFRDFLDEYIEPQPGNIITEDGKVWGQHRGLWHATIGQRLGISMPQGDPNYQGTWFVSEKRPATNELVIVRGGDNPSLFNSKISVDNWSWLCQLPKIDLENNTYHIQYRSLQFPIAIKNFRELDRGIEVELTELGRAIAPGQNLVIYNESEVIGSGVITRAYN